MDRCVLKDLTKFRAKFPRVTVHVTP